MSAVHLARPVVRIDSSVVTRVHEHARRGYPLETCGLLLGGSPDPATGLRHVKQAVIVPNHVPREQAHHRYAIDPKLMLHWDRLAAKASLQVLGVFHAHPDAPALPSAADAEAALPGFVYLITSVSRGIAGETAAWVFDESVARFVEALLEVRVDEPEWVI